jgi:hypothetical protein
MNTSGLYMDMNFPVRAYIRITYVTSYTNRRQMRSLLEACISARGACHRVKIPYASIGLGNRIPQRGRAKARICTVGREEGGHGKVTRVMNSILLLILLDGVEQWPKMSNALPNVALSFN